MLLHITDEETYHIYYQNLINSSPIDKDNRITIDHRANQGLKIIGKEQDLRNCLTNLQKAA